MAKPFVQLVAVLCLALPTPTFGFNAAGHKIIADMAWQKLPPAQRQAIAAMIKNHPRFDEDFEDDMPSRSMEQRTRTTGSSVTRPDIARGIPRPDRNQYHRARWHYINLPVFLNGSGAAAFSGGVSAITSFSPKTAPNEEMLYGVQAVKNSLAIIASPSTSDEEKAVHCCWLLHVIPDFWERWRDADGGDVFSCTLLATEPDVQEPDRIGGDLLAKLRSKLPPEAVLTQSHFVLVEDKSQH